MDFNAYSVLMDFGLVSMLLFIATFLRAKLTIFQKIFMPASLIAGLLGLLLSQQVLGIISFSSKASSYSYLLIILMFASLRIGHTEKHSSIKVALKQCLDTTALSAAMSFFQFGFALVIGTTILYPFIGDISSMFSTLMPAGFMGGHGYAVTVGEIYVQNNGFTDANDVGITFATFGLLLGVFIGVILINIGVRKGWSRFVPSLDFNHLPISLRTGLLSENEQVGLGKEKTNSMVIDSLAWTLSSIVMVGAAAYCTAEFVSNTYGFNLPTIVIAMLYGLALQWFLDKFPIGKQIDKKTVQHIGGSLVDYLVAFSIATLNLQVIITYAVPLLILTSFGIIFILFFFYFVARKLFNSYWFERSIFILGWSFGILAIAVTLLRIIDPDFKSDTLSDYATAYTVVSLTDLINITLVPLLVAQGFGLSVGFSLICAGLICCFTVYKVFGIQKLPNNMPRPGEALIAAQHEE